MKQNPAKYRVSEMVALSGREVLRLPPDHCQLNPIEFVLGQAKNYVAANNKKFKLPEVEQLFNEGLGRVTPDSWGKCIHHVKNQVEMYRLDYVEGIRLKFTVNIGSSDESDWKSETSGVEELGCSNL